jgi:glyoxylase-like metal-dependent hydrolase (beta-lactamase superfamily II)
MAISHGSAMCPGRRQPAPVRCLLALAILLLGLAGPASRVLFAAPHDSVWQVYAIRYATVPGFPLDALVAGADSARKVDIAMTFWLLRGPGGRCVLVDAGFYRRAFLDSWKPADFVRPSEALERIGVSPDSVGDLILTHIHWDHLDGADLFPNARVWIQRDEYEHYVGERGAPAHEGIDSVDAAMLAGLRREGRVTFVEGDGQEILPGVTAYTGGRHTFASQYLGVRTAKGTVVIASDNVYLYENLDRHLPIAQTLDAKSNLEAQRRMRRIASAGRLIVPGHDPAVFQRFRHIAPGVVIIE